MPEGKAPTVLTARRATAQLIHCIYHKELDHFRVMYLQDEGVFIIECAECKPGNVLVRLNFTKELENAQTERVFSPSATDR